MSSNRASLMEMLFGLGSQGDCYVLMSVQSSITGNIMSNVTKCTTAPKLPDYQPLNKWFITSLTALMQEIYNF